MMAHRRLFALAAVFFIAGCLISIPAAAQRRKAKPAAKTAASQKRGQKQTSSRSSSRRSATANRATASRGKKGRRSTPNHSPDERYVVVPTGPPVPDQIEVVESGAARLNGEALAATRPLPRATPDPAAQGNNLNSAPKRMDVNIDSARVIEIQEALAKKGFYNGLPSGVYDDATVEAMRQFQASNQIDVTGYPTAHALKRLGLTSW